jgi:hypothetical protein
MVQTTNFAQKADTIFEDKVVSGGNSGKPDTRIVVTDQSIRAEPIDPDKAESTLDFHLPLDDIEALRCSGVLDRTVALEGDGTSYTIPANQLDRRGLTSAVVENSPLTSPCSSFGLGGAGETICERLTCVGCVLILGGIGLSLSVVGLLLGIPLIGIGLAVLLVVFLRGKICAQRGANVWRRPDSAPEPAN